MLRSGADGVFGNATAETDFGTDGEVLMRFFSQLNGREGNGIEIVFTKSDHGNASGPYLTVEESEGKIRSFSTKKIAFM